MKLDDYNKENQFEAAVLSSERITPEDADVEIRELVLEVDRADFDYSAGQSIGVLTPGPHDLSHDYHFRLYTVADTLSRSDKGRPRITIAVRRCTYIDDYSGERFKGVSSNYLCDLKQGDKLLITGPYGFAFEVPEDKDANLVLIGAGTGIAPFRAFVKHIYNDIRDWKGKVRLFYGAHTGLELIYMNEYRDDFAQYYDQETFEAFSALSPRPNWADPIAWDYCLEGRSEEILEMLDDPKTHIYVAGLEEVRDELDDVFSRLTGSEKRWQRRRAELVAGGRWTELLY
ncbi:MAG: ferredoxin-NADP reductase [Gammaproteobacteria bacterium]|jgi:ferredoxin--NADP+ reductase|nr:ferredoxin-NADP reductase [Gammaproteobacteria bacterium]MDH3749290.1 ferredoxin-NADP reductase [Gammaproteobacteria bacterium]MDH3806329.1 ferredoxin-NADP reductase [Gammaproteobacteria bacterium]